MLQESEWSKYGKKENQNRRIAVPVSGEMEKLIAIFKDAYPDRKFSDTKVIGTFVEAGAKLWVAQMRQAKTKSEE